MSKSTLGERGYVTKSYYDDYTPDMAMGNNYDTDYSPWRQSAGDAPLDRTPLQNNSSNNKCNKITMHDENSTGWSS